MSSPPGPPGAPAGPAPPPSRPPPPPPPYYGPYPYGPYPSRRSGDASAVIVILVLVVFLVIPLILTVLFLTFFAGLLAGPFSFGPLVLLGNAELVNGNVTIPVEFVSSARPPTQFTIQLEVNGTASGEQVLPGASGQAVDLSVASISYHVRWMDLNADGAVSRGDTFDVAGSGRPLPRLTDFTFTLRASGSVFSEHETWRTS